VKRLVLESWLLVFRFEWIMRFAGFEKLCRIVRREPVRPIISARQFSRDALCRAMDYACVFYFKPVLCLQRSAATTLLLRRHGWSTQMLIGAQILPFKSHAWCEIDDVVVNDKPYMRDLYAVLERC
jgi:hypothetical protein